MDILGSGESRAKMYAAMMQAVVPARTTRKALPTARSVGAAEAVL